MFCRSILITFWARYQIFHAFALRDPLTLLYENKKRKKRKPYDAETLIMSNEMSPRKVDYREMGNE
jgi:hypothetical protein